MDSLIYKISDARRNHLREWIDTHYNGSQMDFSRSTGIRQAEVSQLLKDKSFGERRAASIEKAARMPKGYLVNPLSFAFVSSGEQTASAESALAPDEAELLRCFRRCPADLRPAALAAVRALAAPSARKKSAS